MSKDALNIDGFGKKIVQNFWEIGLIKLPHDIFSLDFERISKLDGWGSLSVNNLKKSIQKAKKISLDKFIFSLGIRHIEGVGPIVANEIVEFWSNQSNCIMVDECFVAGLMIEKTTNDLSERLSGKTFVFTGSLKTISRKGAKEEVQK